MPSVEKPQPSPKPKSPKKPPRATRKIHLLLNDCPSECFALWGDKSFKGPGVSKPGCVRVEFFPPAPPASPPPPPLSYNDSARPTRILSTPDTQPHGNSLMHIWSLPRTLEDNSAGSSSPGTKKTAQKQRKRGIPRRKAPTKLERAEESFRAKQEPVDEMCPPTPPPPMEVRWATPEFAPPSSASVFPDIPAFDDIPSLNIHCASPPISPPPSPPDPPPRPWSSPADTTQLLRVPAYPEHWQSISAPSPQHRTRPNLWNRPTSLPGSAPLPYAPQSDPGCSTRDSLLAAISRRELPPLGPLLKQAPRAVFGRPAVRIVDLDPGVDGHPMAMASLSQSDPYSDCGRRAGRARFAPYQRPAAVVLPPLSQLIADCKKMQMQDEDALQRDSGLCTEARRYGYDGRQRQRMHAVSHRQTPHSSDYSAYQGWHSD